MTANMSHYNYSLIHINTILSAVILVGLNEPSDGLESVGPVEVCAVIFGPGGDDTVNFDFELHLRTVNSSAGNIHVH